jgi:hypothetical protein
MAAEAAQAVASEAVKNAAESATGSMQTSMNIVVKCDRKDLKLKFANHFVEGGAANNVPKREDDCADEIEVKYISNILGKGLKGILICKVQQTEQEFPDETLIIVGWEVSRFGFGPVRTYTVLGEAEQGDLKYEEGLMKYLRRFLRGRLREYTEPIE